MNLSSGWRLPDLRHIFHDQNISSLVLYANIFDLFDINDQNQIACKLAYLKYFRTK